MNTKTEAVATPVVDNGSGSSSAPAPDGVQAPELETPSGFREANGRPSMVGGVKEYDEWSRAGLSLRAEYEKNEGGIAWQAAKWLVDGYRTFLGPDASNQDKGSLIRKASRFSGLRRSTLIAYIKVGFAFPKGPRVPELSFAHHRAVALIPNREDAAYWIRQAAEKKMSVLDLKKAVKDLIPSKPKVGINAVQEADRYATRLRNLNPKDHIWDKIISNIQMGRSMYEYSVLRRDLNMCADRLFRNLRQIDGALAGHPAVAQAVQDRIRYKSPQLVEAEQAEAVGSKIQAP